MIAQIVAGFLLLAVGILFMHMEYTVDEYDKTDTGGWLAALGVFALFMAFLNSSV